MAATAFGMAVGTSSNAVVSLLLCATSIAAGAVSGAVGTWACLGVAPVGALLGLPWPVAAVLAAATATQVSHRERNIGAAAYTRPLGPVWLAPAVALVFAVPAWLLARARFSADPLVFHHEAPGALSLMGVVLALAVLNSLGEELLWRQCILQGLGRTGVALPTALATISGSFGSAHLHGLPDGLLGVLGAGAFGLALCLVRLRRGLSSAILVHVVVDLALFSAAARHALFLPCCA